MPRRGLDGERVVEEAARIADAEGLSAVSLSRVAAALGIRPPSLYNHVSSHADLRRRLAALGLRELGEELRDAAVGRAGEDAIAAIADRYRAYVLRCPGRYAATIAPPGPGDDELADLAARPLELLTTILGAWGLEGDAAVHQVRVIRAALHGFTTLEAAGGFRIPLALDESFARMVAMLIAGIERAAAGSERAAAGSGEITP